MVARLLLELLRHVCPTCVHQKDGNTHDIQAALNWPNHRGSATAFPLAAFGLSAFFFSMISSVAFPDSTSSLLLLLAGLTFTLCFTGFFFLHVVPQNQAYAPLPQNGDRSGSDTSTKLRRTKSGESKYSEVGQIHETGTQNEVPGDGIDETSSLFSNSSSGSEPGAVHGHGKGQRRKDSREIDVRSLAMLKHVKFYQLWLLLGLLTGIGVMTIKYVSPSAIRLLVARYVATCCIRIEEERCSTGMQAVRPFSHIQEASTSISAP